MLSLRSRIFIGIALPVVMTLIIFAIALSLPTTSARFIYSPEQLLIQTTGMAEPETVIAFQGPEGSLPAYPELAIDEPDVIETYPELNRLFADIDQLTDALESGALRVETTTGQHILKPEKRQLSDLNSDFWIQVTASFIGLLICTLVWLPGNLNLAKAGFILTGISYFLLATSAGIYSSRNLFIAADLFQPLSLTNLMSTNLFIGGLCVLLWNYPKTLVSERASYALFVAPLFTTQLAVFQVFDELLYTVYLPFGLLLLTAIAGMIQQFRKSAGDSATNSENRAILRWILLFIAATTIPSVLKLYTDIPQSVMIASFVFVYAGMMIAITRHRMFDIERWSYKLWIWFAGGMAVLLADVAIASAIGMSQTMTLAISLAVIGWLYFPVRQLLWRRFFTRKEHLLQDWLTQSLPELLRAQQGSGGQHDQHANLISALKAVFNPLAIELKSITTEKHSLSAGSTIMHLAADTGVTYVLSHPSEGRRQFRDEDMRVGELVLTLNELVQHSLSARQEGAQEERARIRQDLHDDLGAKLLRLLYRSHPDDKPLVKEAIQDLRTLLQRRSSSTSPVKTVIQQWQDEAQLRCNDHDIDLHWQYTTDPGQIATQTAELSAIAISQASMALRETISNAIRHRSGGPVTVSVSADNNWLTLTVANETEAPDQAQADAAGMGLSNIEERMQRCGGQCRVSVTGPSHAGDTHGIPGQAGCWKVILSIPVTCPP